MDHHTMSASASPATAHATIALEGLHCLECAQAVEDALRASSHITSVHVDWLNNVAHVGYHPSMITVPDIEALIATTGCSCDAAAGTATDHAAHVMPAPQRRLAHLAHGVDTQPITMGTRHDRMQYEMPATAAAHHAHAGHAAAPPAPADHAGHAMADHDHAGHAMSDPGMAAAMERDMRNKFFIALLLTIPIVLYSPLGMNLLGVSLPTFGLSHNVIMLLLTTPVVFYCGWLFIAGAYYSLR
ncbi:MAG: heavy metal translocating P-type ATPase, partial [Anaerolineae bacterium]|nr:heavy metal translocating P-type ATPase [Anaerolineae bacterium]